MRTCVCLTHAVLQFFVGSLLVFGGCILIGHYVSGICLAYITGESSRGQHRPAATVGSRSAFQRMFFSTFSCSPQVVFFRVDAVCFLK